jgi:hypothetical protein
MGMLSGLAIGDRKDTEESGYDLVRTMMLDSYVFDGSPVPDFIKINVEGAEK